MNKKQNNNKKNVKQLQLFKPLMDAPMARDINLQFQVYAIYNQPAGITLYSFSSSTTQVTPTLRQDLGAALIAATEFQRYAADFAYYKWGSVIISPSNNTFGVSNLTSVPPMFYRVAPHITGTVTADGVGRSDNSVEYKITNMINQLVSTHSLPAALFGVSGNIVGGSSSWLPTNLNISTQLELQIGNITNPDFTGAASLFVKIVTLDVICKVVFASPYVQ